LFGSIEAATDQFVDLTVTSGPYNIGKEYEKSWVLDEYLNWCEQWIAEVYRVTIDRGAFWLNLGYL
jgi:DNA modification methylase